MNEAELMKSNEVVSAKLATCYVKINGETKRLCQAKNVEVKYEKDKADVAILGQTTKGHRATGGNITGSMTVYNNTSIFDEMLEKYHNTGEDTYFDMIIVNEDPTAAINVGKKTTDLLGVNIDNGIIANFDADGDWLEQDIDFTAEGFYYSDKFKNTSNMEI